MQYGTNDARLIMPVPSGLGLGPVDIGYPGSFKANMQQIINAIRDAGKEVCLAKIPIALGSSNSGEQYLDPIVALKNIYIQEFNDVIDELVADSLNNIVVPAPDFFSYFSFYDETSNLFRYEEEYSTNYHPNGIGYYSMANLWFDALTQ